MSGGTVRETSLVQQTCALLRKNLLVQWRRLGHVVLEWLQHFVLVLLLFLILLVDGGPNPKVYLPAEVLGRLDEFSNRSFPVGYIPTTPAIRDIMQRVNRSTIIPGISVQEFQNASDLLDAVNENMPAGVEFVNEFTYYIRYDLQTISSPNDYLAYRSKRACDDQWEE
ncbi:unnamed protein product, partial [Staurois parvus]